jgi:hypothetical protein
MRKVLLAAGVIASIIIASCNKCSQCSYTYKSYGTDTTVVLPKTCGSNDEVTLYESNSKAKATQNNSDSVVCENVDK